MINCLLPDMGIFKDMGLVIQTPFVLQTQAKVWQSPDFPVVCGGFRVEFGENVIMIDYNKSIWQVSPIVPFKSNPGVKGLHICIYICLCYPSTAVRFQLEVKMEAAKAIVAKATEDKKKAEAGAVRARQEIGATHARAVKLEVSHHAGSVLLEYFNW